MRITISNRLGGIGKPCLCHVSLFALIIWGFVYSPVYAQQSCPVDLSSRIIQNGFSVVACLPGVADPDPMNPSPNLTDTLAIKNVTQYGTLFDTAANLFPTNQDPNTPTVQSWDPPDFDVGGMGNQNVFSAAIDPVSGDIFTASTRLWGEPGSPGAIFALITPGPTGVYRINGQTGAVSLIVNITATNANENLGASYVTYDESTQQLFVVGMDTGTIYRIDPAGSGPSAILQSYNPDIDATIAEDDGVGLWAPLGERILGLAWNPADRRLYYSVWLVDGTIETNNLPNTSMNTIRSVALNVANQIDPTTDRLEISLPFIDVIQPNNLFALDPISFPVEFAMESYNYSMPVGDIDFNHDGTRVLLAETGYNSAFDAGGTFFPVTQAHRSRVLEYNLSGGIWTIVDNQSRYGVGEEIVFPIGGGQNAMFSGINARGGASWAYDTITPPRVTGRDDFMLVTGDVLQNRGPGASHYGYQYSQITADASVYDSIIADLDGNPDAQGKGLFGDVDIFMCAFSLGDFVWFDTNRDGDQDMGEPGLPNVQVELFTGTGCAAANATGLSDMTSAAGIYSIDNIVPGTYSLAFSNLPAGAVISAAGQGGNGALDSDANPATACIESVVLTANDINLDVGVSVPGSIGDRIWCDGLPPGDGIFTAGEGLSGIRVDLFNDAACDGSADGTSIDNTDTAGDGLYSFTNLATGPVGSPVCYVTQVDQTDSDLMACNTLGSASTTTAAQLTQTSPNDLTHDYFFLESNLFSLGDFVWFDTNRNGQQDMGEPGVQGVTANLYNNATCTGAMADDSDDTDAGGIYGFTGLSAGNYCIEFTNIPAGWMITTQDNGNNATDSDVNPTTMQIQNINLTATDLTLDMGLFAPIGLIGDTVWCDGIPPGDGVFTAGEGIAGIQVNLFNDTDCNGSADGTAINSTDTVGDGAYSFANLNVGPAGMPICYTTQVDQADADLGLCNTLGSASATTGAQLTVVANSDLTHDYFFQEQPLELGDFVWFDTNRNGQQDMGEPGVQGVTANLYNNATCTGAMADDSDDTDAGGIYGFTGLSAGAYCIEFTNIPAGWMITTQDNGNDTTDSDVNPATMQIPNINLTATDLTLDMGLFAPIGLIGDTVWCDGTPAGDGIFTAGEGVAGIQVSLFNDTDCNGSADGAAINSTDTVGDGNYSFSSLDVGPAGTPICYITEVDQGDADLGLCDVLGSASGTTAAQLTVAASTDLTHDYYFVDTLLLGDFVWYDTNRNGQQDTGEPGVEGIDANLYSNATCTGAADETDPTDMDGIYGFGGLGDGDYCIEFTGIPTGWVITTQNNGDDATDSDADTSTARIESITLAGLDDLSFDMGLFAPIGSVGDQVWCESTTNPNMSYDPVDGDLPLPLIEVSLFEGLNCSTTPTAGTALGQMDTDDTGQYAFDDLLLGPGDSDAVCYVAQVDAADADLGNCRDALTATQIDGVINVDNPTNLDLNFGFEEPVGTLQLGDFVWYDNDQDGQFDNDEAAVENVQVDLYLSSDCSGAVFRTDMTDGNGVYLFDNLAATDYCLSFTQPAGWIFTLQNQGDDSTDSDVDPTSGQITDIALTVDDLTLDAGVYAPIGSIEGVVFCDDQQTNSMPDPGEELPNIRVDLFRDSDCDAAGDILLETVDTGLVGEYAFTGLAVGFDPAPPNPRACYVVLADLNDPDLGSCRLEIITPPPIEISTGDPDELGVVFGVFPVIAVPTLSRWGMIVMVLMVLGVVVRRQFFGNEAKKV